MQTALLMVTWFYMGQAPSTTLTHFNSMEACLVARHFILRDAVAVRRKGGSWNSRNSSN